MSCFIPDLYCKSVTYYLIKGVYSVAVRQKMAKSHRINLAKLCHVFSLYCIVKSVTHYLIKGVYSVAVIALADGLF